MLTGMQSPVLRKCESAAPLPGADPGAAQEDRWLASDPERLFNVKQTEAFIGRAITRREGP